MSRHPGGRYRNDNDGLRDTFSRELLYIFHRLSSHRSCNYRLSRRYNFLTRASIVDELSPRLNARNSPRFCVKGTYSRIESGRVAATRSPSARQLPLPARPEVALSARPARAHRNSTAGIENHRGGKIIHSLGKTKKILVTSYNCLYNLAPHLVLLHSAQFECVGVKWGVK